MTPCGGKYLTFLKLEPVSMNEIITMYSRPSLANFPISVTMAEVISELENDKCEVWNWLDLC